MSTKTHETRVYWMIIVSLWLNSIEKYNLKRQMITHDTFLKKCFSYNLRRFFSKNDPQSGRITLFQSQITRNRLQWLEYLSQSNNRHEAPRLAGRATIVSDTVSHLTHRLHIYLPWRNCWNNKKSMH